MKTVYPQQPCRNYDEWRAYIAKQVLDAKTERIINQFKQDLIKAYTKKQTKLQVLYSLNHNLMKILYLKLWFQFFF